MTCPCKAELASIRSAIVEDVLAAAELCRTSGNKSGADAMDFLAGRLSRPLSPAPAEPQEPSPRYEVWLGTRGWIVGRYCGDDIGWLDRESGRFLANNSKPGSEWASFPTESAARAALLAASEPGKEEAGQPRPRRWPEGEAEITENKWMLRWLPTIGTSGAWWPSLRREMKPGDYWLSQPPAPPAEKEPPHAN